MTIPLVTIEEFFKSLFVPLKLGQVYIIELANVAGSAGV